MLSIQEHEYAFFSVCFSQLIRWCAVIAFSFLFLKVVQPGWHHELRIAEGRSLWSHSRKMFFFRFSQLCRNRDSTAAWDFCHTVTTDITVPKVGILSFCSGIRWTAVLEGVQRNPLTNAITSQSVPPFGRFLFSEFCCVYCHCNGNFPKQALLTFRGHFRKWTFLAVNITNTRFYEYFRQFCDHKVCQNFPTECVELLSCVNF